MRLQGFCTPFVLRVSTPVMFFQDFFLQGKSLKRHKEKIQHKPIR